MLAQCGESPGRSVLRSKKYGTVVRQYRVLSVRYLRIRAADPAVRPIGAAATQSQPSRHFLVRIQHIVARTDLDHFARRSRRYPSPPYCAFFRFFLYGPLFVFFELVLGDGSYLNQKHRLSIQKCPPFGLVLSPELARWLWKKSHSCPDKPVESLSTKFSF